LFVASGIQHAMHIRRIVICGLSSSTVFSPLSHKRHDYRKTLLNINCLLIFCTTFARNISDSKKNRSRYHECALVFIQSACYSCQIFEKCSNFKFHENPSSGRRAAPFEQTDRHKEANSRFSKFCERT